MGDPQGGQQQLDRLRRLPSWLFGQLALRGTRLTADVLGNTSLRSDFALLAGLEAFGPLSQAELGRRLGMDRSNVAVALAQLERDQYVHRETDPADRRRNTIHLTHQGQAHLDHLERELDRVQSTLLQGLTPDERDQLLRLLRRVLDQHQGHTEPRVSAVE